MKNMISPELEVTIKERRKISCKRFSFIRFVNKNISEIIAALHNSIISMPDYMNYLDHRFEKSDMIVRGLREVDRSIESIENEHYDISKDNDKISLKLARCTEHNKIKAIADGIYTKEKDIILKNFLGKEKKDIKDYKIIYLENYEWDYLFIIDPQEIESKTGLSVGIISFDSFKKLIDGQRNRLKIRGDQLVVKIKNREWDYFYRYPGILPEYNKNQRKKMNEVAEKAKNKYFNTLLNYRNMYEKIYKYIIEK